MAKFDGDAWLGRLDQADAGAQKYWENQIKAGDTAKGYENYISGSGKEPTTYQQRKLALLRRNEAAAAPLAGKEPGLNEQVVRHQGDADDQFRTSVSTGGRGDYLTAETDPSLEGVLYTPEQQADRQRYRESQQERGGTANDGALKGPNTPAPEAEAAPAPLAPAAEAPTTRAGPNRSAQKRARVQAQQEAAAAEMAQAEAAQQAQSARDIQAAGQMALARDNTGTFRGQADLGGGFGLGGYYDVDTGGVGVNLTKSFGGGRGAPRGPSQDFQRQQAALDQAAAARNAGRAEAVPLGYDPTDPLANLYAGLNVVGRQEGGMIPGYKDGKAKPTPQELFMMKMQALPQAPQARAPAPLAYLAEKAAPYLPTPGANYTIQQVPTPGQGGRYRGYQAGAWDVAQSAVTDEFAGAGGVGGVVAGADAAQQLVSGDVGGAISSGGAALGSTAGTAIGTAFGGPLGGAIGGAIGSAAGEGLGDLIGGGKKEQVQHLYNMGTARVPAPMMRR